MVLARRQKHGEKPQEWILDTVRRGTTWIPLYADPLTEMSGIIYFVKCSECILHFSYVRFKHATKGENPTIQHQKLNLKDKYPTRKNTPFYTFWNFVYGNTTTPKIWQMKHRVSVFKTLRNLPFNCVISMSKSILALKVWGIH